MKRLFTIILAISPILGFAQKVKYKDIFPVIITVTEEEAKNHLQSYLLTEPDHPNSNLRLAMIYENGYKSSDALTEYKKVLAYAERTKLRYLKSRLLIDDKEVSKNDEYYASFATSYDKKGRPEIAFATIRNKIDNGYDSAELIIKKLPEIYSHFTRAVNSYGRAHSLFFQINNRYKSLDDLFMLYDEKLHEELLSLRAAMDSSLINFEKYRKLIDEYPINEYNQKVALKPVNYYRLDGLAELSNFLQDDVQLWNYSEWVDQIMGEADTEVNQMRKNLSAFEKNLNNNLQKLQSNPEEDALVPDRELIYKIKKYDYESLVVSLLEYKNFKQQLIKKEKQKIFYDTASQGKMFSKYNFYSELIKQQVFADSLLKLAHEKNTAEKRKKYQGFIDENYQGEQGLNLYLKNEKDRIVKSFNTYQLTVRNDLVDELNMSAEQSQEWAVYKKMQVPLFVNTSDSSSLAGKKIIATAIDYRADSSRYVAGYIPVEDRNIAFLAHIDGTKKVLWLKEFDISIDSAIVDATSKSLDLEITKDGCAVFISSTHLESGIRVNTLLYLDDEGNEKINTRLEIFQYPRRLLYDQGNSRFILSLRGEDSLQQITAEEPLYLVSYNTLGDKLWERQIKYSGSFETLTNLNDGYLIGGNYTSITDHNNKTFRTKGQLHETNAFLAKMSLQGDILMIKAFEQQEPYYITAAYKINDGSINFFGFKDKYLNNQGELSYINDKLFHLMVNEKLEKVELD